MTRLFLAAGVAALAITMPASAKPGGGHGGGKDRQVSAQERGGGQAVKARGGGGGKAVRAQDRGGGNALRMQSRGGRQAVQQRSFQRGGESQRRSFALQERGHGRAKALADRPNRGSMKAQRVQQREVRSVERGRDNRFVQREAPKFERQQARGKDLDRRIDRRFDRSEKRIDLARNREILRNELRANRIERLDNGIFVRDARNGPRLLRAEDFGDRARGWGVGGCPPGLVSKGCMPPGQAAKLLGTPLSAAARFAAFDDVPYSIRYLYPDTDDYFYRFGNGYLYRVDRDDSLISALLPLAFGGFMPGSYLPNYYMSSPYYGMSSFYPTSYGFNSFYRDYGDDCHRYGNGVIYEVDCFTGFVEDAIPLYAGGYGVGQILPAGYGYYNVPYQYRSLYYDTSDYGYWYAPGAIYQYDPSSSLITSVAALLSPGFNIGQPLPMGYDVYNVPYAYRSTYFDSPTAMYRYNNGYIYQVDPTTMLVTAIVASILT
ncbi:MAG TPA: hypothetical protein VJM15_09730 [Sphingomicrobium sp.]|nr:hypothetical protein [Sphingomicrobium sp.]